MRKIEVKNKSGRLYIQFMHEGLRYSLYGLGNADSNSDNHKAELLARVIESDILEHCFDTSLKKYKHGIRKATKSLEVAHKMFLDYADSRELSQRTLQNHYLPVYAILKKTGCKVGDTKAIVSAIESLSPKTYNMRLSVVKSFGRWLVSDGYVTKNPYDSLTYKKQTTKKVKPFTSEEVKRILEWIRQKDELASRYYCFAFLTGCRPGEILGLQWSKVDWIRQSVTIDASFSRSDEGYSRSDARVLKETKTGDTRVLPLIPELAELLRLCEQWQIDRGLPQLFVFCTAEGKPLNDNAIAKRVWRPCLEALGIEYRQPYATRHTAASMLLSNGCTIADCAQLLGHKSLQMVQDVYVSSVSSIHLPSYK